MSNKLRWQEILYFKPAAQNTKRRELWEQIRFPLKHTNNESFLLRMSSLI